MIQTVFEQDNVFNRGLLTTRHNLYGVAFGNAASRYCTGESTKLCIRTIHPLHRKAKPMLAIQATYFYGF